MPSLHTGFVGAGFAIERPDGPRARGEARPRVWYARLGPCFPLSFRGM